MPNKYVIAVDPGKATGFAILEYSDIDNVLISYSAELEQYETSRYVEELLSSAEDSSMFEIVIEEFKITPQTGKNSPAGWSLEIIGSLRYLAQKYGVSFTEQPPSRAKNFVPNDRMKKIGIWHKGGEGHARDALRHGVLYLVEKKNWRPAGLLDTGD